MSTDRPTVESREKREPLFPHAFPFLFATLTVTALAASNPYEGTQLRNLSVPLFLALSATLLFWVIGALLVAGRLRRSLTATAAILPVLLSGYLFGWLRGAALPGLTAAGLEIGLLCIAILASILLVGRIRWPTEAARFLNLFAGLALLITSPGLLRLAAMTEPRLASSPTELPDSSMIRRPDIYLIVVDAYSGLESLRRFYNFDNSPFLDTLRALGFSVPSDQRSNYMRTFLSLGSMLNREYLDDLSADAAPDFRDRTRAYNRMAFNRTTFDLKRLGYDFYYVGSSYPPLARNRLADEQYAIPHSTQFERFWLRSTAVPPFLHLFCRAFEGCSLPDMPFQPETAAETESRITFLNSLVDRPGPKFVYAHLLLPHGPYRFDRTCEPRASRWTVGPQAIESDSLLRRLYIEQVECTNNMLLEFLTRVDASPSVDPIVILQADHGSGRFPADHPTNLDATSLDQIEERFDIFAAYRGPRGLGDSIAVHRTPVNVFRTVFRVMWGIGEAPLEERTFWSESDRSLLLKEIDGQLD